MVLEKEFWLKPDRLFDGYSLSTGNAVHIRDNMVVAVAPDAGIPDGALVHDISGTLTPGLFDIQVNGGGDVLFNTDPTADGLARIAAAHRSHGTTHWLPTVITDGPEVLDAACDAILNNIWKSGITGIHIEGPHIAIERRGTHRSHWIRPFDNNTLTQVERLRSAGIPVLITVAPEAVKPGDIASLVALGAVVSLGHTNANSEQTRRAMDEGAQLFTHLFNAMSQIENRELNVVGTAINSENYCSIIVDGLHVDLDLIGMTLRARPVPDRMILISDAMPTIGGSDEFILYGNPVKLREGRLINSENSLAGAHITLFDSLANLVNRVGTPLDEALRMVTSNPATLMGLGNSVGSISPGTPADLVVMNGDLTRIVDYQKLVACDR